LGESVTSAGEVWIYLGFFVTLVAAGLGFPAPEELVISGAGVLAGQLPPEPPPPPQRYVTALMAANPQLGFPAGVPWAAFDRAASIAEAPPSTTPHVRWWIMLPVCILGVVLSDIILYSAGRWFGKWLFRRKWLARILRSDKHRRMEENFHRYGVSILVFGRLVPGIRAPLFLTAGSMHLPLPRFLLADGLGAIVGNSLFFFLGFWLGDSIKTLIENAEERLKPILIIVAIGLLVAYLLWHFLRHPVPTGDPAQEVPLLGSQVASHIEHAEKDKCEKQPPADKPGENKSKKTFFVVLLLVVSAFLSSVVIFLRRRGRRDAGG
jgi:membrane protein DedA with SNARE-associated domain